MSSSLSAAEFDDLFQRFADSPTSTSVFRWEARQHYAIAKDEPSLIAFRAGTPRPERSVRTSPWLARIATSTAAGKDWSRLRYISEPLTEYVRWELLAYVESQAAGERILIVPGGRSDRPAVDFWVFDGTQPADRYGVLMHYEEDGTPIKFEYVDHPHVVAQMQLTTKSLLDDSALPLNTYFARYRGAISAA